MEQQRLGLGIAPQTGEGLAQDALGHADPPMAGGEPLGQDTERLAGQWLETPRAELGCAAPYSRVDSTPEPFGSALTSSTTRMGLLSEGHSIL
jgi:hypothetical protein